MRQRSSAIDLAEHSDDQDSDDSEIRREKSRSRRVTTIGEEMDSKLSIEEFHQKLTWERWSGNGHLISSESGQRFI
jgi:hypothetical protein